MSPELAVLLRPRAAYHVLAEDYPAVSPLQALRRPALVALAIAVAISITATGRAPLSLVVSTLICWSFAVAWQLLAAATVTRVPHRSLSFAQRLDLFFAGHAPWSVWLLTCTAWSRLLPGWTDLYALLCTAAVPAGWTTVVVYGFCTGALGLTKRRALRLTLLHQALVWSFVFLYIAWAVALWPRLLAS